MTHAFDFTVLNCCLRIAVVTKGAYFFGALIGMTSDLELELQFSSLFFDTSFVTFGHRIAASSLGLSFLQLTRCDRCFLFFFLSEDYQRFCYQILIILASHHPSPALDQIDFWPWTLWPHHPRHRRARKHLKVLSRIPFCSPPHFPTGSSSKSNPPLPSPSSPSDPSAVLASPLPSDDSAAPPPVRLPSFSPFTPSSEFPLRLLRS